MPDKNIEPKDNLTIALSASVVAREALQFLNPSSNTMLLKLKYKATHGTGGRTKIAH